MARRLELHDWDDLPGTEERGPGWAMVLGNSIEVLEKLPPRSVDLIFADPPYHLSNGGTTCQAGRRVRVDKGEWDPSRGVEADHAFQRDWLQACRRVLKPSGTIWVSGTQHVIFSVGYAMQELGFHLLNTVTWFKPNAAPNLACRMFTHSTEILLWAAPMKSKPLAHRFNYRDMKQRRTAASRCATSGRWPSAPSRAARRWSGRSPRRGRARSCTAATPPRSRWRCSSGSSPPAPPG